MAIEFELKYGAAAQTQQRILEEQGQQWQRVDMETTYYDTPSGALSARYFTLRRRLENGRSVCTVKAPVEGPGRGEWELECPDIHGAIPELCKLGGPKELIPLTAEGVIPWCGARFTRFFTRVTWEGAELELALDRGILFAQARELPLCEVEVELKQGLPEAAQSYAEVLARRYDLLPEKKSKFARARALRKEDGDGTAE